MRTGYSKPLFLGLILLALSGLSLAQNQSSQDKSSQNQPSQSQSGSTPPASQAQDSAAQSSADSGNSLAGAARSAKVQKATHAKKVFTDEDMEASTGPLPRLKMDGAENADDVVAAISNYKLTHTPEQTEQAVRIWYDRYDQMLAAAIQENQDVTSLHNANISNGYALCQESQDYQQCQSRQMAEQRGAMSDQQQIMKNNMLSVRIQHSFMKVRNGLQMNSLHYTWFRIRTTNNIDMY